MLHCNLLMLATVRRNVLSWNRNSVLFQQYKFSSIYIPWSQTDHNFNQFQSLVIGGQKTWSNVKEVIYDQMWSEIIPLAELCQALYGIHLTNCETYYINYLEKRNAKYIELHIFCYM